MADGENGLQFFERGVGMFLDVRLEFGGVELAPGTPARFGGQRLGLGGGEIAVNGAPGDAEAAGGFDLGAAGLEKLHHPLP